MRQPLLYQWPAITSIGIGIGSLHSVVFWSGQETKENRIQKTGNSAPVCYTQPGSKLPLTLSLTLPLVAALPRTLPLFLPLFSCSCHSMQMRHWLLLFVGCWSAYQATVCPSASRLLAAIVCSFFAFLLFCCIFARHNHSSKSTSKRTGNSTSFELGTQMWPTLPIILI